MYAENRMCRDNVIYNSYNKTLNNGLFTDMLLRLHLLFMPIYKLFLITFYHISGMYPLM